MLLRLYIAGFLFLASCSPKFEILPDGWTRVTKNDANYKNRNLFSPELLEVLDTNAIYEECCYIQTLDSSFFGSERKKYRSISYPNQNNREFFRFYNNGYCNCFISDEVGDQYNFKYFNPENTGFRGVYFQDKNHRIQVDLFTQTSGEGRYSNLKLYLAVSGDSLFIKTKNDNNSYRVYIKKELSAEIKNIKGWTK